MWVWNLKVKQKITEGKWVDVVLSTEGGKWENVLDLNKATWNRNGKSDLKAANNIRLEIKWVEIIV